MDGEPSSTATYLIRVTRILGGRKFLVRDLQQGTSTEFDTLDQAMSLLAGLLGSEAAAVDGSGNG